MPATVEKILKPKFLSLVVESLFEHIRRFSPLSIRAMEAMSAVLRRVDVLKGDFLIEEGKVSKHIYFIEKGCVRGYYNQDGKEITYWFAFEQDVVTSFFSFITRKPSVENIQLLEDGLLWAISYDDLQELYANFPDVERFGRLMNEHYYVMLEERFVGNHFTDARTRYENLIQRSPHILQRVPLGYVASYLGITQETLSRIRSKS